MVSNIKDNNWDTENYHKISNIQEAWATEILEKRKMSENEVVLDAGCGTGRVTKIIANNVLCCITSFPQIIFIHFM